MACIDIRYKGNTIARKYIPVDVMDWMYVDGSCSFTDETWNDSPQTVSNFIKWVKRWQKSHKSHLRFKWQIKNYERVKNDVMPWLKTFAPSLEITFFNAPT